MAYVSNTHKEQAGGVRSCKAVQTAMVMAVKQLETDAANHTVTDYIIEALDPIYEEFDNPSKVALSDAITNANWTLCGTKGFIERAASKHNTDPDFNWGWRFADGGEEAAERWIVDYPYISELIANVVAEYEQPDAVDEVISISMEEDPYEDAGSVLAEETDQVVYEEIHSEEGVLLAEPTKDPDVDAIKARIKELTNEIGDIMNDIAEMFDRLPSRNDHPQLDKNRQACGLR